MEKEKPIDSKDLHIGCLNCSTAALKAPLDMEIAVGFGCACVTKDGKQIYDEQSGYDGDEKIWTVGEIEKIAEKSPESDWRIIKHGPMHGETYQRHSKDEWVCIESNRGFA